MAVIMGIQVFWYMMLCGLVSGTQNLNPEYKLYCEYITNFKLRLKDMLRISENAQHYTRTDCSLLAAFNLFF